MLVISNLVTQCGLEGFVDKELSTIIIPFGPKLLKR